MSVKPLFSRRRAADAGDPLAINSRTWHQYYATVQSDVYPHMLLEQAMERRQERAMRARRRRPLRQVLLASLLFAGLAVWLVL
jgi:hypothetical protein